MSIIYIIFGMALLYAGGEFLVRNSAFLARALGVSSLIVGLTVVAFGTSSPELFASLIAAFNNAPEVTLGGVVGSNIANIGFILGLAALICPMSAERLFIRREVPLMILSGALLIPICWNGTFGRLEGLAMMLILIGYLTVLIREARTSSQSQKENGELPSASRSHITKAILGIVFGVTLLVVGADFLVAGATTLARAVGISDRVIGLTMVAFGTSLPEIAACVVAAIRKEADIVLGNLIGSNIFNSMCVLGTTTMIIPIPVDWSVVRLDLGVMLGITFLVFPFLSTGMKIGRIEGATLLALYLGYIAYLFV